MVDWGQIILVGIILVVFVIWVLPVVSNMTGGGKGSIGGGAGTTPEGDIGQGGALGAGGILSTKPPAAPDYLPSKMTGTGAFTEEGGTTLKPSAEPFGIKYVQETPFGKGQEALTLAGKTEKGTPVFMGGYGGHTNVEASSLPPKYFISAGSQGVTLVSKIPDVGAPSTTKKTSGSLGYVVAGGGAPGTGFGAVNTTPSSGTRTDAYGNKY